MQRKFLLAFVGVVAALAVPTQPLVADPPPTTTAKADTKSVDWKEDPACRMVFFAVLEGLYADGVTDDVVECIVGKAMSEKDSLKKNFVPLCPICHPVYEAFALYGKRPSFKDDSKRNTFGKDGLSPEIIKALKSDSLRTRVLSGIQPLVAKYVGAHMKQMNLTDEQKAELTKKLMTRVNEGTDMYSKLRETEEGRKLGWLFYGGCGACGGTKDACSNVLAPKTPEK